MTSIQSITGASLEYLRRRPGCDDAAVNARCATWITDGVDALEALLATDTIRGDFCLGVYQG